MVTEFRPLVLEEGSLPALEAMRLVKSQIWTSLDASDYGHNTSDEACLRQYMNSEADFYTLNGDNELLAVGSLAYKYDAVATIGVLAVNPAYQWRKGGQRYGFGTTMLTHLEQAALGKQIDPSVRLIRVQAFHESLGFYLDRGYKRLAGPTSLFKTLR